MISRVAERCLKTLGVIKPNGDLNRKSPVLITAVSALGFGSIPAALEHQNLRTKEFEGRKLDKELNRAQMKRFMSGEDTTLETFRPMHLSHVDMSGYEESKYQEWLNSKVPDPVNKDELILTMNKAVEAQKKRLESESKEDIMPEWSLSSTRDNLIEAMRNGLEPKAVKLIWGDPFSANDPDKLSRATLGGLVKDFSANPDFVRNSIYSYIELAE